MDMAAILINGPYTVTICINFQSPFNRRLHMKFEENWLRGLWEVIQRCRRTKKGKWSQ